MLINDPVNSDGFWLAVSFSVIHQVDLKVIPKISFTTVVVFIVVVWTSPSTAVRRVPFPCWDGSWNIQIYFNLSLVNPSTLWIHNRNSWRDSSNMCMCSYCIFRFDNWHTVECVKYKSLPEHWRLICVLCSWQVELINLKVRAFPILVYFLSLCLCSVGISVGLIMSYCTTLNSFQSCWVFPVFPS